MTTIPPMLPNDPDAIAADMMVEAMREQDEAEQMEAIRKEEAEVDDWKKKITESRAHDSNARKQYAIDRTYVGGEAGRGGFDVRVPIAGAYVDLLTSFLYARDPSVDIQPADSAGPSRKKDARLLGRTLQITLKNMWSRGKLKAAARQQVRSSLSVGIGWIKCVYLKRTERDPLVVQKIADLQDNLQRIAAMQKELEEGDCPPADQDVLRAAIEAQISGLEANVEVVKSAGLVFDYIPAEDIQVSSECPTMENYLDAPWIAHRMFFPKGDGEAMFPDMPEDQLKKATIYTQRKPKDPDKRTEAGALQSVSPDDADAFHVIKDSEGADGFICVWEIWDHTSNNIRTWVEGTCRWAKPTAPPEVGTTRFYPFFQWAPIQVDGKRHPDSLPARSVDLLDEYNRTRSNYREYRRRAMPKSWFDRGAVEPDEAKRMEAGAIGEMVGLDIKGQPLSAVMGNIPYPGFDPALYDTGTIRAELEIIWGIQEALSSSIRTAKTLGEAEIQQQGTEARQSFYRDSLDEMFFDLSIYSSEIAFACLSLAEVQEFAGPEAFWTEGLTLEQMQVMLALELRAGSSSKAASGARQQRWVELSPIVKETILTIGQMRNSSPMDVADCLEQLLIETLERFGETIDPTRFIPKAGNPVPLLDPNTGQTVLAFPAPNQPPAPAGATAAGLPAPAIPAAPVA